MDLFIATSNAHKVEEFKKMCEPLGYTIKSMKDLPYKIEIEENGTSFEENALIKARAIAKEFHIAAISDDSGLEVDALNKEPGIYSARYMGEDTSYTIKNQSLIDRVKDASDRTCRFVCCIGYVDQEGKEMVFRGTVEGTVAYEIIGEHGFGYDPIFYYEPFNTTLGNVSDEMKNTVSHRHNALVKFVEYLKNEK